MPARASQPLVSVLTPAWNAAASIERALGSVLDDPDANVQMVVVDDASTDATAQIVEALAARDRRVELIRAGTNAGPSAARNLGLPTLRGEWIAFLDSDDRFLPGALATMVAAAERTDALAVVGQRIWSDGTETWISNLYDQPDIREPGRKSILRNPGLLFYSSGTGKLFHRSTTDGLRFAGRVLGDQPWTIRALLRAGDRIQVIEDTVYEWTRPGPGSTATSITARKQGSALVAAEAATVALEAFRDVYAEARATLAHPVDQDAVAAAYAERLIRADFAGAVLRALDTRDPGLDALFEAVEAFIMGVPKDALDHAPSIGPAILRPPFRAWDRMTPRARQAYIRILRAVPGSATASGGRDLPSLSKRLAFGCARAVPRPMSEMTISGTAAVASVGRRIRDRSRSIAEPATGP